MKPKALVKNLLGQFPFAVEMYWLLRHRKDLDDASRKANGHERAVIDGLEAAEKGIRDARAACRACGKAI